LCPGIGPSAAARVLDDVEGQHHAGDAIPKCHIKRRERRIWLAFAKLFKRLRKGKMTWPAESSWWENGMPRTSNEFITTASSEGCLVLPVILREALCLL
jgi:hypothetical protein